MIPDFEPVVLHYKEYEIIVTIDEGDMEARQFTAIARKIGDDLTIPLLFHIPDDMEFQEAMLLIGKCIEEQRDCIDELRDFETILLAGSKSITFTPHPSRSEDRVYAVRLANALRQKGCTVVVYSDNSLQIYKP